MSDSAEDASRAAERRSSITQSFASEDSQTVVLDHAFSAETKPEADHSANEGSRSHENTSKNTNTEEPSKCWICFMDETEDSPTSSEWRSPCPCALKAHEACLLDWVADLDKNGRREGKKIECPQCKGAIRLREPRNFVVDNVRHLENWGHRNVWTFAFAVGGGCTVVLCWLYGFGTVYLILGHEEADRVLGLDAAGRGIGALTGAWLALTPLILVVFRTPLVTTLLPMAAAAPLYYLLFDRREFYRQPPNVLLTLSYIPALKTVYNVLWNRYAKPLYIKWQEESGKKDEPPQPFLAMPAGQGNGVEMEVGVQMVIEEEFPQDAPVADVGPAPPQAGPVPVQVGDGGVPIDQARPPAQGEAQAQPGDPQQRPQRARRVIMDLPGMIQFGLQTLSIPLVSFATGSVLGRILPSRYVVPPRRWDGYPVGFLQSRLGRTLVGGCLFLVLKDTLKLYSTYQSALVRRERRILDHEGKAKAS